MLLKRRLRCSPGALVRARTVAESYMPLTSRLVATRFINHSAGGALTYSILLAHMSQVPADAKPGVFWSILTGVAAVGCAPLHRGRESCQITRLSPRWTAPGRGGGCSRVASHQRETTRNHRCSCPTASARDIEEDRAEAERTGSFAVGLVHGLDVPARDRGGVDGRGVGIPLISTASRIFRPDI
jgi:hypothetical protein